MPAPVCPIDEHERLAALRESGMLERRADQRIKVIVELAASLLQRPGAAFSLVDAERQVVHARSGSLAAVTPREGSFCAQAILRPDRPLVVEDAARDGRFAGSPLVIGKPGVRLYAGVPVRSANGHALGALCVLDREPGTVSEAHLEILKALAEKIELIIQEGRPLLRERRILLGHLRQAVLDGAFDLEWQPIVQPQMLRVAGYEVLIRWNRPDGNLVGPDLFIPLAEASGLIGRIDRFVLEAACAQAARWNNDQGVSVNVSPRWFRLARAALPEMVAQTLARTGLRPGRLTIEITERVLIADPARAVSEIDALRALGVRMALDDFGTGYSSLGTLEQFPFDIVKLDKTFVDGLGSNRRAEAVARTIMRLGHDLGMTICAEGVEQDRQFAFLDAEGCDLVQGYLVGRPAPHEQAFRDSARGFAPPARSRHFRHAPSVLT